MLAAWVCNVCHPAQSTPFLFTNKNRRAAVTHTYSAPRAQSAPKFRLWHTLTQKLLFAQVVLPIQCLQHNGLRLRSGARHVLDGLLFKPVAV
jgi:hypothetical protein